MGTIEKDAVVFQITEAAPIPDGQGGAIDTMTLGIELGKGTAGEQRVSFMVLASDYEALGSPGYGEAVTVTLATP